jgi:hypothetical protein
MATERINRGAGQLQPPVLAARPNLRAVPSEFTEGAVIEDLTEPPLQLAHIAAEGVARYAREPEEDKPKPSQISTLMKPQVPPTESGYHPHEDIDISSIGEVTRRVRGVRRYFRRAGRVSLMDM